MAVNAMAIDAMSIDGMFWSVMNRQATA
jgi:hypothetical protein